MNTTRRRFPRGARRLAVAVLVAAAFGTLLLPGSARATAPVIDQEQPVIDSTGGFLAIFPLQKLAQVVTPAVTGSLTEVRLSAACRDLDVGVQGYLDVEVQGVTGGIPNGTVLGRQSAPFSNLFPTPFRGIVFSTPVPVTAGSPYALVLTSPNSCGTWEGPVGDPYPGGNGFYDSRPNPPGWFPLSLGTSPSRADLPFQTLVAPRDTTAPSLAVPGPISVRASGLNGARVAYAVTATDDLDPNPDVTCTPPSGSVFPIGRTTVNCAATDAAGNSASGSFTVEVLGGARYQHVAITFVTDWGDRVTRWEGDVATGTVMAMVNDGALEWLAADASYGDPAVALSMDLRSRHIARLMTGSLTATRGSARIQFRNVITPVAVAADGTITTPFPIPATFSDGRGFVSGHVTLRFSNE